MRTPIVVAALLSLQLGPAVHAQQDKNVPATPPPLGTASYTPPPSTEDAPLTAQTFVVRAAVVNMAEIELGEQALTRSADPAVQAFARKMIAQHREAQTDLEKAAMQAKIALPATVDEKHRQLKQQLSTLQGKDFDREYAKAMASGHDDAIALFDAAAHSDKLPPGLKSYATRTLPVIRTHRDAAQKLHAAEARQPPA